MAKRWQIVEREGVTSGWSVPRTPKTVEQFDSEEEAIQVARDYVTEINVDNALTSGEKEASAEVFFKDAMGIYLGHLDGKPWYMKHKKDLYKDVNGKRITLNKAGDIVQDPNYFELEKKGEVAVRPVPGT